MSPWKNLEEMKRAMHLMLQDNPYFAWQREDGSYRPCRDVDELNKHALEIFEGSRSVGFYSIQSDDTTYWGAIDLDDALPGVDWDRLAKEIFAQVGPIFSEAWLEESSPGRYHVVLFQNERQPAAQLRNFLIPLVPEGVEIFPKQDKLAKKPDAMGSLLRFPGKHQKKGTWSRIIDRQGLIEHLVDVLPGGEKPAWRKPEVDGETRRLHASATHGLTLTSTGQRFHAMQRLVGKLKGAASSDEQAELIYRWWHSKNAKFIRTPLDEALRQFRSWYAKAEPRCVELPDFPLTAAEEQQLEQIRFLDMRTGIRWELVVETMKVLIRAKKHADSKGMETFFLSCPKLADELDVSIATAGRYLLACRNLQLIERVTQGGYGRANHYKFGMGW